MTRKPTPIGVDSLGSVRTGDIIMRAFYSYSASKGRYSSDSDPDDDPVITGKRKEVRPRGRGRKG